MKQHTAIWRELATVADGDASFFIEGVCPWEHAWEELGLMLVNLPNLAFPDKLYEREVYRISAGEKILEFCAFEVSANAWRFWVPRTMSPSR